MSGIKGDTTTNVRENEKSITDSFRPKDLQISIKWKIC